MTYGLNVTKLSEAEEKLLDNFTTKSMSVIFGLDDETYHKNNKWMKKSKKERKSKTFHSNKMKNGKNKRNTGCKGQKRRKKIREKTMEAMIENKQTTTPSWIKYLRRSHVTKAYYRGEIDITHPDYLLVLDEEQDNWREMKNTVCGKLEYSKKWRRHALLNENQTKPDCASTGKNMIQSIFASGVTFLDSYPFPLGLITITYEFIYMNDQFHLC